MILIALFISLGLYALIVTLLYIRQRRLTQHIITSATRIVSRPAGQIDDSEQRFLEKADEAMRLTQTFQKFVPRQFVEHFAKHGNDTLELGRAAEDEVAILLCDIRGFSGLSEQMSPQELMNFLNSYFLRMNDPIHQNGGFIDKFIGDAIMALFNHPGGDGRAKALDAVRAAIDLQQALKIYNAHRANVGYAGISVGVGIHFGPVILGTVGSDDRMDTTVIGDSVNVAFRLESLAPKYHADIVVSAQTLSIIGEASDIQYRVLDWVRVKGRRSPVRVYEVLNHLDEPIRQNKLMIQHDIEQGLACRIARDFPTALTHFHRALSRIPGDPVVSYHIDTCQQLMQLTIPQDWDGSVSA
ncbi:adenylate/guanylate cyclase domain-containing protein [Alteromonas sp. AMM-1]|uniref:adenylate/guanylate cyclase domain-containing protein n=1 Tax=Alteromonas sp. AMM-1 TaxID=3394233 RepID=UPI0039A65D3E